MGSGQRLAVVPRPKASPEYDDRRSSPTGKSERRATAHKRSQNLDIGRRSQTARYEAFVSSEGQNARNALAEASGAHLRIRCRPRFAPTWVDRSFRQRGRLGSGRIGRTLRSKLARAVVPGMKASVRASVTIGLALHGRCGTLRFPKSEMPEGATGASAHETTRARKQGCDVKFGDLAEPTAHHEEAAKEPSPKVVLDSIELECLEHVVSDESADKPKRVEEY